EGVWRFSYPGRNGTYSGQVSIDRNGSATSEVKSPRQNASQSGSATVTGNDVTITFVTATPPYSPDTFRCTLTSPAARRCSNEDGQGNLSTERFVMTRTAPPAVARPSVSTNAPNLSAPHANPGAPSEAAPNIGNDSPRVPQPTR